MAPDGPDPAQVMARLGEVVWLMLQAEPYRQADLVRVEALMLQPLLRDQLRVFRRGDRPLGFVAWALLDAGAEARYLETGLLAAEDWACGDRFWFTDFVAPLGEVAALSRAACALIPKGRTGFGTRRHPDGSVRRITRHASRARSHPS
jgi:cytolysin-activating lysine-acyltransferase